MRFPRLRYVQLKTSRPLQVCLIFLASAVLMTLKSPDALLRPQFWAEDGTVFFSDQLHRVWPQIMHPYSGYLHLFPRVTAWIANYFPIAWRPLIFDFGAILMDSAAVTYATLRAGPQFGSAVVFLSFFLLPTSGELFGTLTNVQWFLQFVLLTACCLPRAGTGRPSWPKRLALFAVLLCAAPTGPVSWLLSSAVGAAFLLKIATAQASPECRRASPLGLAAERIWWAVNKEETWIVVAGAILHLAILAGTPIASSPGALHFLDCVREQLGCSPAHSTIVQILVAPTAKLHLLLAAVMGGATVWVIYSVVFRPDHLPSGILIMFGIGLLEPVLANIRSGGNYTVHLASLSTPSRYYYLLGVLSVWVIGREFVARTQPGMRRACLAVLAVVLIAFIALKPEYFSRAPLADYRWDDYADQIEAGSKPLLVPLNPAGWGMEIDPPGR